MKFVKYSATGNDFILLDGKHLKSLSKDDLSLICKRRTGVGCDGVLFYLPAKEVDFEMKYLNADGGEVGMCGNGARALSHYMLDLFGLKKNNITFKVQNKIYESKVDGEHVSVKMTDIDTSDFELPSWKENFEKATYIVAGVPHTILLVENVDEVDLEKLGPEYSHDPVFSNGCNINFVQKLDPNFDEFKIRTFERGVEGETLSCGTGATASAIALRDWFNLTSNIKFQTRGGDLEIQFHKNEISLCGIVKKIYNGELLNK